MEYTSEMLNMKYVYECARTAAVWIGGWGGGVVGVSRVTQQQEPRRW